jgi:hypothetical protein
MRAGGREKETVRKGEGGNGDKSEKPNLACSDRAKGKSYECKTCQKFSADTVNSDSFNSKGLAIAFRSIPLGEPRSRVVAVPDEYSGCGTDARSGHASILSGIGSVRGRSESIAHQAIESSQRRNRTQPSNRRTINYCWRKPILNSSQICPRLNLNTRPALALRQYTCQN